MAVYRVTLFINQFVMGASETYWTPDLATSAARAAINSLLSLRNAMLWDRHKWIGVRLALDTTGDLVPVKRRSIFLPPGPRPWPGQLDLSINVPEQGVFTGDTLTTQPDQFRASMQIQLLFPPDRQTIRYLFGIPDSISASEAGTLKLAGNPSWVAAFSAWRDFLVNTGWRIKSRTLPPGDPLIPIQDFSLQEAAPGRLGLVLSATDPVPNMVEGDRVQIRGQRSKANDLRTMNGIWHVSSVNTTLLPGHYVVYLRGSEGIQSTKFQPPGTVQRVRHQLSVISAIHTYRMGIHKRGRPTPAPRGRRLTRPSLDI